MIFRLGQHESRPSASIVGKPEVTELSPKSPRQESNFVSSEPAILLYAELFPHRTELKSVSFAPVPVWSNPCNISIMLIAVNPQVVSRLISTTARLC
jgi:hypothetical protein